MHLPPPEEGEIANKRGRCKAPEPGKLRRALWEAGTEQAATAWHELGQLAKEGGWARRFLLDVIQGRTAIPPEWCMVAVGEWGRTEPEEVISLARDADRAVAAVACAGLGRLGVDREGEIIQLAQDRAPPLRVVAVAGLVELAAGGSWRAVAQLAAMLGDPAGEVRWAAAAGIGRARRPACVKKAVASLRRACEGEDERALAGAAFGAVSLYSAKPRVAVSLLRAAATRGVVGRRAVAAAMAELPPRAGLRLAQTLATDADATVRCLTAAAFSGWTEEAREQVARALGRLAADPDAGVRAAAAAALGNGVRNSVHRLLRTLARDRVAAVRAAAVASLGKLGEHDAVRDACWERDPLVRAAACAYLRDREDTDLILSLTDDRDLGVARAALSALGHHATGPTGPVWDRLLCACAKATVAGAASVGMARVMDQDRGTAAEVIWHWPVALAGPEILMGIAQSARDTEVSDLARSAHRALTAENEVAEGLDDLAIALAEAGRAALGGACQWLAEGARIEDQAGIASLASSTPGGHSGALSHLVTVSRLLATSQEAGNPRATERGLRRARAGLETPLAQGAETLVEALVHRVGRRWQRVLTRQESPTGRAALQVAVVSRQVIAGTRATALLSVRNLGREVARRIAATIGDASTISLSDLPPGGGSYVPIALHGVPVGELQIRGEVSHEEATGGHIAAIQGVVTAVASRGTRRIRNPYVVGKPLTAGSAMFFGREEEMAFVERTLASGESGAVAVLIGQRRIGKTSLLRQLQVRLGESYRPILIDVQGLLVSGVGAFFVELARRIAGEDGSEYAVREEDPLRYASAADMVREAAGSGQRVVLLLDEFDDLEEKVRVGRLNQEVFSQLRNLIQHSPNIGVVLCGTHRLEELASAYWSFLLNLATYCTIKPLDEESAPKVIMTPLGRLGIVCEDAAAWAATELSGSQPYLLQLLGYRLVERCVCSGEGAVRFADVEQVAQEVVEQGEIHLQYLWELAGARGREVLRELAGTEGWEETRHLTRSARMTAGVAATTIDALTRSALIFTQSGHCRPRVGLLGRWLASRGGSEAA